MARTYWVETLGCPKNSVDSEKLVGTLAADGLAPADDASAADLVVVNTCAFIEEARQESIDTILALTETRADGAEVVVTGCMAERYGAELAEALPEVAKVAPFGHSLTTGPTPVTIGAKPTPVPDFDLLNLPRPAPTAPWAYLKVAEGCDRKCGFCAIPSFRGPQRSRSFDDLIAEADGLADAGVREIVLIAQDLASYGRDVSDDTPGDKAIVPLVEAVAERVDWVRLLYLFPTELGDRLIDVIGATGVPYYDLSLQHVSAPLVRRMRRWGNGDKYLERIAAIRDRHPDATFRSSFIVGYPGETDADHEALLEFLSAAQLDWCGLFRYSAEAGTYAADLDGVVDPDLMTERINEASAVQDPITAAARDRLVGQTVEVLVDEPGVGRSHREAPEIDGIVSIPDDLAVGQFHKVTVTEAVGPDLVAVVDGHEAGGGAR